MPLCQFWWKMIQPRHGECRGMMPHGAEQEGQWAGLETRLLTGPACNPDLQCPLQRLSNHIRLWLSLMWWAMSEWPRALPLGLTRWPEPLGSQHLQPPGTAWPPLLPPQWPYLPPPDVFPPTWSQVFPLRHLGLSYQTQAGPLCSGRTGFCQPVVSTLGLPSESPGKLKRIRTWILL